MTNKFVYGEKVRVNLSGGSYLDTFIALTPGGERAVLLGADDDKPYTVPVEMVEAVPNLRVVATKIALRVMGPEGWTGFRSPVENAAYEVLTEHFTDGDVK